VGYNVNVIVCAMVNFEAPSLGFKAPKTGNRCAHIGEPILGASARSRMPLDDCGASTRPAAGLRRMMGFSVMRSPDRGPFQVGRRIASGAPLNRLHRSSDAAAPGN
jgi:hypothetical protein